MPLSVFTPFCLHHFAMSLRMECTVGFAPEFRRLFNRRAASTCTCIFQWVVAGTSEVPSLAFAAMLDCLLEKSAVTSPGFAKPVWTAQLSAWSGSKPPGGKAISSGHGPNTSSQERSPSKSPNSIPAGFFANHCSRGKQLPECG